MRALALLILAGCTATTVSPPTPSPSASESARAASPTARAIQKLDADRMFSVVSRLASLGPREATGATYRRAASFVESELRALGYEVRRQSLSVPAGVSWGVPVPSGRTFNIVASPPAFDVRARHFIVGAHLDTVPQSPGANDNASGIAVMLDLARMMRDRPIRFIAFGAEEPRGRGDDRHHYGSRHYVARSPRPTAMLSLDRVGIGDRVRVCSARGVSHAWRRRFLAHAPRAIVCTDRNSDHWSFEKAGIPGVRLLGSPHPTYHTPRDRPDVVSRAQLLRIARIAERALTAATARG